MEASELRGMSEDELAAALEALSNEEQPAGEVATQEPQGVPVPQPSAEEMPATTEEPAPTAQPQQQGGDLNVALRQEREHRRQLEAALQDPEMLRQLLGQYEQPQQPELALEDPEAINALIQQAIAPYVQQVQQLTTENHQTKAEKQMLEMRQQHPDFDDAIAAVDQQMPHLANLQAQDKHLVGQGLLYRDPNYLQNKMAQQLAQAKEAGQQEALAKLNQPTIKGPDGIARAGASSLGNEKPKTSRQMSDAELAAKIKELS